MTVGQTLLSRLAISDRLAAILVALALPLAAAPAAAQPLPAACPNGGPNYAPFGLANFTPLDVGTPMLRYTLPGVDSTCNDGSPAILYLRPATAYYTGPLLPVQDQHPDRWVIVFHGGGGCGTPDECLERWCGIPGFDRAGKMSTLGAYDAVTPTGILGRNPAVNDFAGYNQVLLNYCSSDNWVGSASLSGVVPAAGPSYDIEFQGEAIVNDAFTQLLAGVAPDAGPAGTFWSDALPSLADAEEIVLVGESAGGGGLRHHLDRLEARLRSQLTDPAAPIVGVVDAGMTPGLWDPAISWAAATSPASYADYLQNWAAAAHAFWGTANTAIDASCLDPAWTAAHNAVGSHPEICFDTAYTLLNHITTPFFSRQDIDDPLGNDRYATWALYPGPAAFTAAQANQLFLTATFAGGLEQIGFTPGVSGTHCQQHVTVLTGDFYTDTTAVPPAWPVPLSFHDLLSNWLAGAGATQQVQPDLNLGPVYTPSNC